MTEDSRDVNVKARNLLVDTLAQYPVALPCNLKITFTTLASCHSNASVSIGLLQTAIDTSEGSFTLSNHIQDFKINSNLLISNLI